MYEDDTGLIYMRARYYSPELRRFINADKVHGDINNALTLNRYAFCNGDPANGVDPTGFSKERGGSNDDNNITSPLSIYVNNINNPIRTMPDYPNTKEYKKVMDLYKYIVKYSNMYGVDPGVVSGAIFVEQFYNYNLVDVVTDWVSFYGIIDMSVGVGQVRLSTAEFLEESGYVPKTTAEEAGWNIPLIGFVHGTETMAREKRLEDDEWNVRYVAAYIKSLEDLWSDEYPDIVNRPDILGSLYNLGHHKVPHGNPEPNWFGDEVKNFYDFWND